MNTCLVVVSTLLLVLSTAAEGVTLTETVEAAATSEMTVSVGNINGIIAVEGSDQEGIQATYTINCSSQQEMEAVEVVVTTENGMGLSVEYDEGWNQCRDCSVDFLLTVPRSFPIDYILENVNGEISLSDASGSAELSLVNGDLELLGFQGTAVIDVVNGDVTVERAPGLTKVGIVNGSADLSISEQVGNLTIESINAGVTVELLTDARVLVETLSGEMEIDSRLEPEINRGVTGGSAAFGSDDSDGEISIHTLNGDVKIN